MTAEAAARFLRSVSALLLLGALVACSKAPEAASFVGKWQSSRLSTPLLMTSDGKWEVRDGDGAPLQFGVWELKNGGILWSFRIDGDFGQDWNALVSFRPREFRLRERDGAITTFTRLD